MRKTCILLLIVLSLDMACAKKGGSPETSKNNVTPEVKTTVTPEPVKYDTSPELLIRRIYEDHQPWNHKYIIAMDENQAYDLSKAPTPQTYKTTLAGYFDDELTNLIVKDYICGYKRPDRICYLDYDPIFGNNGAGYDDKPNPNLKISKIKSDSNTAIFEVTYTPKAKEEAVKRTYHLRLTDKGWRVSDVIDDEFSLKKYLKRK